MSRLEMEAKVGARCGLESEVAIWFCSLAERHDVDDALVTMAFVVAMNMPVMESED